MWFLPEDSFPGCHSNSLIERKSRVSQIQGDKDEEHQKKVNHLIYPASPACPVKFTEVKGNAYFTGVTPADGTGVKFLSRPIYPVKSFWLLFNWDEMPLQFIFHRG